MKKSTQCLLYEPSYSLTEAITLDAHTYIGRLLLRHMLCKNDTWHYETSIDCGGRAAPEGVGEGRAAAVTHPRGPSNAKQGTCRREPGTA